MKEMISDGRQFCKNFENIIIKIFEITQPNKVHDAKNLAIILKLSAGAGLSQEMQKSILKGYLNRISDNGKKETIRFFCKTLELELPQDFSF